MNWSSININEIPDGVYYDMPIEVYHGNKTHYSASSIKEAFKSMAHFKAYFEKEEQRQSFFDFGNAFELSLTDNDLFNESVAIYDEEERPNLEMSFRSKENKIWKAEFYSSNEDKLILPLKGQDSLDILTILKVSFFKHETAKTLVSNCNYQTSIFWTCKETGLKLKTRPDFWKPSTKNRGAIVTDLKTDKNTTKDRHTKAMCDSNYPIQAVMQLEGLLNAGLINEIESTRFFWVVSCKQTPFNTEVYEFDSTDITLFLDAFKFKLEEIARAKAKGVFLSYNPNMDAGIKTVNFPFYYKQKLGINNNIDQSIY